MEAETNFVGGVRFGSVEMSLFGLVLGWGRCMIGRRGWVVDCVGGIGWRMDWRDFENMFYGFSMWCKGFFFSYRFLRGKGVLVHWDFSLAGGLLDRVRGVGIWVV